MLLAAILWLPLAVLELAGVAHGVRLDVDHFDHGEIFVGFVVVLVFELLTTELLAAAAEKMVGNDLHGTHLPTFGEFLRTVPWVRLLLGALVYELGVAVGLLLFVVPGVLMFVWGVVSGPVIVAEGCSAHPGAVAQPRARTRLVPDRAADRAPRVRPHRGDRGRGGGSCSTLLPHDWALVTGEYFVHVLTTPLLGMGDRGPLLRVARPRTGADA